VVGVEYTGGLSLDMIKLLAAVVCTANKCCTVNCISLIFTDIIFCFCNNCYNAIKM